MKINLRSESIKTFETPYVDSKAIKNASPMNTIGYLLTLNLGYLLAVTDPILGSAPIPYISCYVATRKNPLEEIQGV